MSNVLADLRAVLERSLEVLQNEQQGRDIYEALHDDNHLPQTAIYEQASKVVDLLHETKKLLEPNTLVLADFFFGYSKTKCLCAVVELGVPEILRDGPKSIEDIATKGAARTDRLRQVMRLLVNHGVFAWDQRTGLFSNNRTSILLLKDHWMQWHNWVKLYGNQFYDIARGIPASCKAESARNAAQHNFDTDEDMFTYFQQQGWSSQLHKTLAGGAIAQAPGILADYDWSAIDNTTFLDIGGGTGGLLASVLRAYPRMKGAILDLPHVVEQARLNFHASDGAYSDVGLQVEKSDLISGDFLKAVPPYEVYSMKWCLHDWDDTKATTVLRNVRQSIIISPKSRLIIFEFILSDGRMGHLTGYADINMMTTAHSGQERDGSQWRTLAQQTGWRLRQIYPLRNSWPCAIELTPAVEDCNDITVKSGNAARFPPPPIGKPIASEAVFLEPWDSTKGNPFIRSSAAIGYERTNINWVTKSIWIRDARPTISSFTLDTHGFTYETDPIMLNSTVLEALQANEKAIIKESYYPHIERLVKLKLNAEKVIIFDHTIRRRNPGRDSLFNAAGQEQPAVMVHCDQAAEAAKRRLQQNLEPHEDVQMLLSSKRVILVNIWRPLRGPVEDWPLGTVDSRTIQPTDAHDVDLWNGKYENHRQTMAFEANDQNEWWYLHGHRVDEVTLIKIWDSRPGKAAKFCAHAAFNHPATPPDASPRESVEVRCFVILNE